MDDILEGLQKRFKFIIEPDPKAPFVQRFIFEDGRQYKFQEPPFLEVHAAIYAGENAHTAALKLGIENTFPENDKTPPLTEEFLAQKKVEAFGLWTKLFGEVIFRDNGTGAQEQGQDGQAPGDKVS
jgi:hypothetical protein